MVLANGLMVKIIREGMDDYWRVVYSKSDKGLNATELKWKHDWKRDMKRAIKKYGTIYDDYFGATK